MLRLLSVLLPDMERAIHVDKEKKQKIENEKSRGASDDFEAIKIILDSMPSLKKRVFHKLRELKTKEKDKKVSSKEIRESQRNQSQSDKLKL